MFTYRMYSPFNPLKRTINQCQTNQRKMMPAINWKNLKKHQEKCCQEVRRLIGFHAFLNFLLYLLGTGSVLGETHLQSPEVKYASFYLHHKHLSPH